MPIYMDVHIVPGVKSKSVAEAHQRDLFHQEEFGCKCMTYWVDETRESIFCLIEAPDKHSVEELHGKAHGLVPNKVIEVNSALVESFLGRLYDPANATISDDGLKVFHDPSFRILLITKINDPVLLQHQHGKEKARELLSKHHEIIRKQLSLHGGREAEHEGAGFVTAFTSANKAVACAIAIQKEITVDRELHLTGCRIGINAGEPVAANDKLFGDTILLADRMCSIAKNLQIAIASSVKDLVSKDYFPDKQGYNFFTLSPQDESLLVSLFKSLEQNWQNPDFNIEDYCQTMAMSKSQLYRKTIILTGFSPNILLKEFRLEKAKELMRKQRYTISQITFDSGFTSPSYFTKCFKNKYGLLPMAYIDVLH
jgi:AraC-like DNA-binding protein